MQQIAAKMCRLNLVIIALFSALYGRPSGVLAELVYRATVGDTVQLSCSTKPGTTVSWQYRGPFTEGDRYLCITGNVLPNYMTKLALTGNHAEGDYTLTINNATVNDSGVYTCTEDDGMGQKTSIRLDVRRSVVSIEASTNEDDHAKGLSGFAVGLVVSLVVVFVLIVILNVLLAVWCRSKRHLQRRYSGTPQEEIPLNNNKQYVSDVPESQSLAISKPVSTAPAGNALLRSPVFVSGIALVHNRIFVLRGQHIYVYGTTALPHVFKQKLFVPGLNIHPRNDMTSCAEHHSLYISDYDNRRIFKIPLDDNHDIKAAQTNRRQSEPQCVEFKHFYPNDRKPSGLSVTSDHTLLVSCFDDHVLVELPIDKQDAEEADCSLLELEQHLYSPIQAIKLGDKFVVCHGGDSIWLLDVNGKVTKMLNNAGLQGVPIYAQLAWPCNLAIGNQGQIYAADHYNDRVVELSPELKYIRDVVPPSQKMLRPRRLFFDKKQEILYIGLFNGEVHHADVNK